MVTIHTDKPLSVRELYLAPYWLFVANDNEVS